MINRIDLGFDPGTTERPVGGTRKRIIAWDFEDMDFSSGDPFTYDGNEKITAVTLKAGKVALELTGFRTDVKKNDEVISLGLGPNQFKHMASFVICDRTQEQKNSIEKYARAKVVIAAENVQTASFEIEGMTCAMGCAKTIEEELGAMEGVQKATVDFDSKKATVVFDKTIQNQDNLTKVVEATADGKTYKVVLPKS